MTPFFFARAFHRDGDVHVHNSHRVIVVRDLLHVHSTAMYEGFKPMLCQEARLQI